MILWREVRRAVDLDTSTPARTPSGEIWAWDEFSTVWISAGTKERSTSASLVGRFGHVLQRLPDHMAVVDLTVPPGEREEPFPPERFVYDVPSPYEVRRDALTAAIETLRHLYTPKMSINDYRSHRETLRRLAVEYEDHLTRDDD